MTSYKFVTLVGRWSEAAKPSWINDQSAQVNWSRSKTRIPRIEWNVAGRAWREETRNTPEFFRISFLPWAALRHSRHRPYTVKPAIRPWRKWILLGNGDAECRYCYCNMRYAKFALSWNDYNDHTILRFIALFEALYSGWMTCRYKFCKIDTMKLERYSVTQTVEKRSYIWTYNF